MQSSYLHLPEIDAGPSYPVVNLPVIYQTRAQLENMFRTALSVLPPECKNPMSFDTVLVATTLASWWSVSAAIDEEVPKKL